MSHKLPSFSIVTIEYRELRVLNIPKCHGCMFEWEEGCEMFNVHHPSDDLHCLFCINNPKALQPVKNQYKNVKEFIKQISE